MEIALVNLPIRPVRSDDRADWLRMRRALWPDQADGELIADMRAWLLGERCIALVAERPEGGLCGFAEAAIRPCDADGQLGAFGYLEGWFVDEDVRRRGIGRALIEAAQAWAVGQGCREFLSDAHLDNTLSHVAHRALGFEEVQRLVHFRKRLG